MHILQSTDCWLWLYFGPDPILVSYISHSLSSKEFVLEFQSRYSCSVGTLPAWILSLLIHHHHIFFLEEFLSSLLINCCLIPLIGFLNLQSNIFLFIRWTVNCALHAILLGTKFDATTLFVSTYALSQVDYGAVDSFYLPIGLRMYKAIRRLLSLLAFWQSMIHLTPQFSRPLSSRLLYNLPDYLASF